MKFYTNLTAIISIIGKKLSFVPNKPRHFYANVEPFQSAAAEPAAAYKPFKQSKREIRHSYRIPYRPAFGYLVLVLAVLLMSWEAQGVDASIAEGDIPAESIRLRILANSDSPSDQAVKRQVRDLIVAEMEQYASESKSEQYTIDEAREVLGARLGELEQLVQAELERLGYSYGVKVELGMVPFPTKVYGAKVYPAGDYEALRVTLGNGLGQNWWCVLFPPLCFVDGVSGQATAAAASEVDAGDAGAVGGETNGTTGGQADVEAASLEANAPQAKFFLAELFKAIVDFFRSLFS